MNQFIITIIAIMIIGIVVRINLLIKNDYPRTVIIEPYIDVICLIISGSLIFWGLKILEVI